MAAHHADLEAEGLHVIAEEHVSSDITNIGPAVGHIVSRLRAEGRAVGREEDVDLALREAVTNAVVHGNNQDPAKHVRVMAASDDAGGLFLVVRDAGDGFDPSVLPNPLQSERIQATNGRGVFLMHTLMKDVDFRDGGREVRMRVLCLVGAALCALNCSPATTDMQQPAARDTAYLMESGRVEFLGLEREKDVSAVALVNPWLVVGADEGADLAVLRKEGAGYTLMRTVRLTEGATAEIDIEGITHDDDHLYVTGSHSLGRKRINRNKPYAENVSRLQHIGPQADADNPRNAIFRLRLDPDTGDVIGRPDRIDIKETLRRDDVLGRFTDIPGKENGVDIEGIAVHDGRLFLGFRGPVLRSNLVPVMTFEFESPAIYELRFLDLGGLGIRDINRVEDGFLVLAGPVGNGPGDYELFLWDGVDGLPGGDHGDSHLQPIGMVPTEPQAKAEGFTVLSDAHDSFSILVVYDGIGSGGPRLFQVDKP